MDEDKNDFFQDTQELLEKYIDDRILLFKIQAAEKSGKLASLFLGILIITFLLFLILLFGSIALAMYFGELLNSNLLGFGMVAASYTVILLLYLMLKNKLRSYFIMNTVIKIFFTPSPVEQELEKEANDD